MNELLIAIILGIIEGITEFLPISSTGHLILANTLISFTGSFPILFDVVIQSGAILAVLFYFRKKISSIPWKNVLLSTIPALVIGGVFGAWIQKTLFTPFVVAIALLVGGFFLLFMEKYVRNTIKDCININPTIALGIGLFQCFALIPGTSRAAATIIGAMLLGAERKTATEYSFYLAIPTLLAASGYSLWSYFDQGNALTFSQTGTLALGFFVSFITALLAIAWLMKYISTHDFRIFGYYRIFLAIVVLLLL